MSIQRVNFSKTWGVESNDDGMYVHWQSHEGMITQLEDAFDRERKLYQSTIDTLTALLKNPLN